METQSDPHTGRVFLVAIDVPGSLGPVPLVRVWCRAFFVTIYPKSACRAVLLRVAGFGAWWVLLGFGICKYYLFAYSKPIPAPHLPAVRLTSLLSFPFPISPPSSSRLNFVVWW